MKRTYRYVFFIIPFLWNCTDNGKKWNEPTDTIPHYHTEAAINHHISNWPLDSFMCEGFDFPVGNADGKGPYISRIDGKKYDSWNVSVPFAIYYSLGIHPGEDWGGSGPSESDLGQAVYAIAKGLVVDAQDYFPPWGNIVTIRHIFDRKNKIDTVFSVYIHLKDVYVKKYDRVKKRDSIGTIGNGGVYRPHLHFEIRKNSMREYGANYWPSSDGRTMDWVMNNFESPSKFIRTNRMILYDDSLHHVK